VGFNLADLLESVAAAIGDREAVVCAARGEEPPPHPLTSAAHAPAPAISNSRRVAPLAMPEMYTLEESPS